MRTTSEKYPAEGSENVGRGFGFGQDPCLVANKPSFPENWQLLHPRAINSSSLLPQRTFSLSPHWPSMLVSCWYLSGKEEARTIFQHLQNTKNSGELLAAVCDENFYRKGLGFAKSWGVYCRKDRIVPLV